MKKLLLAMILLLVACQPAPMAPIAESPAKVTEQPAMTPPAPAPTPAPEPVDCATDCRQTCEQNIDKVCGQNTDYYGCLDNCDGYLRAEGCKAVCQSESYPECSILFKGECKQECNKKCATP